jgi:hypothetical protein
MAVSCTAPDRRAHLITDPASRYRLDRAVRFGPWYGGTARFGREAMPRRRGIIVAAVIALLAAVGLVGVQFIRPDHGADPVRLAAGGPTQQDGADSTALPTRPAGQDTTLTPITHPPAPGDTRHPAADRAGPGAPAGRSTAPRTSAPAGPPRGDRPANPRAPAGDRTPAAPLTDGLQAARLFGWGPAVAGDEFSGARLNTGMWSVYNGPGHNGNGCRCPRQVTVGGGLLTITGLPNGDSGGIAWRAGQRYGRWEARMRVAQTDTGGHPYHPVLILWPDSDKWPSGGEIDYAEANAGEFRVGAFLHYGNGTASGAQESHSTMVDLAGWHNYAVEWTPDHIAGYVDGRLWFRTAGASVQPPGPMHQTIQLDDLYPGGGLNRAQLSVAWLRIYRP